MDDVSGSSSSHYTGGSRTRAIFKKDNFATLVSDCK